MPVTCHDCGGVKQGWVGRCANISECRARREEEANAAKRRAAEAKDERERVDKALIRATRGKL